MKFEPALSAITGIPVYSSRHVAPGDAYAISGDLLRIPDPPLHWSQEPVDDRSTYLTWATIQGMTTATQRGRRWKAKDPIRYAIERLGITEADIRDVRDAWLTDHYMLRMWNGRRIKIARRTLVEHGAMTDYTTIHRFTGLSMA